MLSFLRMLIFFIFMQPGSTQQCSQVEINSFGPPPWMVKIQSPEFKDCSGVVLGERADRVLTDADCCPDDATLLVSRGVVGSFVLRIIRRFFKGAISSCLLHLEDYVMFTQPACLPAEDEIESSSLPNGSVVTILTHDSVEKGIWTNDCKIDEKGSSPCVLVNTARCESFRGAAVYSKISFDIFFNETTTKQLTAEKTTSIFKGIVTGSDNTGSERNENCSLILTVEEADESLLEWIRFTKAPVTTQRPKKRRKKPKTTTTPHWAKTTTTSTTSISTTTSTTTTTTPTTTTVSTTELSRARVTVSVESGERRMTSSSEITTTNTFAATIDWLESSTRESSIFRADPSLNQVQVYEQDECADVSRQVEIEDLVSVDCRAAECYFSCPMSRLPNIPYLICNQKTKEWILPAKLEKIYCRMLDPELSLIDFLVKENEAVFCDGPPRSLSPKEIRDYCNPYFCLIPCATGESERTIFCNGGQWPEIEFIC